MDKTNSRESHQHKQRLAPPQEDFIVWKKNQDRMGRPPSHRRTREMATEILRLNILWVRVGDIIPETQLGGQDLRWNTHTSLLIEGTKRERIQGFCSLLEETRNKYNIKTANIRSTHS